MLHSIVIVDFKMHAFLMQQMNNVIVRITAIIWV